MWVIHTIVVLTPMGVADQGVEADTEMRAQRLAVGAGFVNSVLLVLLLLPGQLVPHSSRKGKRGRSETSRRSAQAVVIDLVRALAPGATDIGTAVIAIAIKTWTRMRVTSSLLR